MSTGHALDDADRWDWLILLRQSAIASLSHHSQSPETTSTPPGVIVTCSALKYKYRDVIRVAAYHDPTIRIHFVYLKADKDTLLQRVHGRQGHYMKDSMVQSQLDALEAPEVGESDVLVVDCSGAVDEVERRALEAVRAKMDEDP